jgi:hypothetical protein
MRLAPSLAAFALATASGVLPALAGPDAAPAAQKADATKQPPAPKTAELVKKGVASCEGGDVEEGLAALDAAWAQKQDVETAIALATCEMKAQRWPGAAEHLAFALRTVDEGEQRKALEKSFLAVRDRVGAVKVTVNVEGADVFVGDRYAGQTPLAGEVYVMPGTARVSAKKPGYDEAEKSVQVQARGTVSVALELAAESRRSGGLPQNRNTAPAYVLGGLGFAAAGVGAALYAAGATKGGAADALLTELRGSGGAQPCRTAVAGCATIKSLREGHDTFVNAGSGLLIGGGALLAAGIIYGLWATAPSRSSASLGVTPIASPAGGGLLLNGTF